MTKLLAMPFSRVLLGFFNLFFIFNVNADSIISIGGSVTEIIYALDASGRLIARDSSSTYPREVLPLPDVGYMRALAAEPIVSMAPSLVILEAGSGPPETLKKLHAAGVKLTLVPNEPSFDGILRKIRHIAKVLDKKLAGEQLIFELKQVANNLNESIDKSKHPKVLFVLSFDAGSALAAGTDTTADAMIKLAGGKNVVATFNGYKSVGGEIISQLAPSHIITTHRAITQIGSVEKLRLLPVLASLPEHIKNNIVAMDSLLLLGLGPRTMLAAEQLAAAIETIR